MIALPPRSPKLCATVERAPIPTVRLTPGTPASSACAPEQYPCFMPQAVRTEASMPQTALRKRGQIRVAGQATSTSPSTEREVPVLRKAHARLGMPSRAHGSGSSCNVHARSRAAPPCGGCTNPSRSGRSNARCRKTSRSAWSRTRRLSSASLAVIGFEAKAEVKRLRSRLCGARPGPRRRVAGNPKTRPASSKPSADRSSGHPVRPRSVAGLR